MKGGMAPFIVDFKKGFQLLTDKDMWKIPSKAEVKAAKQQVADYKRQYRARWQQGLIRDMGEKEGVCQKSWVQLDVNV